MLDDNQPRYSLEHGSYYLRDPRQTGLDPQGAILHTADRVTLAFTLSYGPDNSELWTLHKHGSWDTVKAWWDKHHEAARDLFGEVYLVTLPPRFDPDQINSIIECPARLAQF